MIRRGSGPRLTARKTGPTGLIGPMDLSAKRAMLRVEGLNDINNIRFDPAILTAARDMYEPNGPSVDAIVESAIAPRREAFLKQFDDLDEQMATNSGQSSSPGQMERKLFAILGDGDGR